MQRTRCLFIIIRFKRSLAILVDLFNCCLIDRELVVVVVVGPDFV